jgi:hypothetical protein
VKSDDDPWRGTLHYECDQLRLAVADVVRHLNETVTVKAVNRLCIDILQAGVKAMEDGNWFERFWSNFCAGLDWLFRRPYWMPFLILILAFIALAIQYWVITLFVSALIGAPCLLLWREHRRRTAFQREAHRFLDHAKIRRLELELGFRDEDEQDREDRRRREADPRMSASEFAEALSRLFVSGGHQPTKRPDVIIPPTGGSSTK